MIKSLLAVLLLLSYCQAETCTLRTYASSWMATGTPFSVQCPSGVYSGDLVTTPARRFFRRGHLLLRFTQPVAVMLKGTSEGKLQSGRGRQITSMLLSGGSGIGTKDMTDGLSGAIFKSYYMIPITFGVLAVLSNGGDVNLKPGFPLEVSTK